MTNYIMIVNSMIMGHTVYDRFRNVLKRQKKSPKNF